MGGSGDLFLLFVSLICGCLSPGFLWKRVFLPFFECLELLAVFFDVFLTVAEPATYLGSDSLRGGDFDTSSVNIHDVWGACFLVATLLVSYPFWVRLVWFQLLLMERCVHGFGTHHRWCIDSSNGFALVFSCGASVSMSPVSIW